MDCILVMLGIAFTTFLPYSGENPVVDKYNLLKITCLFIVDLFLFHLHQIH